MEENKSEPCDMSANDLIASIKQGAIKILNAAIDKALASIKATPKEDLQTNVKLLRKHVEAKTIGIDFAVTDLRHDANVTAALCCLLSAPLEVFPSTAACIVNICSILYINRDISNDKTNVKVYATALAESTLSYVYSSVLYLQTMPSILKPDGNGETLLCPIALMIKDALVAFNCVSKYDVELKMRTYSKLSWESTDVLLKRLRGFISKDADATIYNLINAIENLCILSPKCAATCNKSLIELLSKDVAYIFLEMLSNCAIPTNSDSLELLILLLDMCMYLDMSVLKQCFKRDSKVICSLLFELMTQYDINSTLELDQCKVIANCMCLLPNVVNTDCDNLAVHFDQIARLSVKYHLIAISFPLMTHIVNCKPETALHYDLDNDYIMTHCNVMIADAIGGETAFATLRLIAHYNKRIKRYIASEIDLASLIEIIRASRYDQEMQRCMHMFVIATEKNMDIIGSKVKILREPILSMSEYILSTFRSKTSIHDYYRVIAIYCIAISHVPALPIPDGLVKLVYMYSIDSDTSTRFKHQLSILFAHITNLTARFVHITLSKFTAPKTPGEYMCSICFISEVVGSDSEEICDVESGNVSKDKKESCLGVCKEDAAVEEPPDILPADDASEGGACSDVCKQVDCGAESELESEALVTGCGHFYHRKCLALWLGTANAQGKCPFCRTDLSKGSEKMILV